MKTISILLTILLLALLPRAALAQTINGVIEGRVTMQEGDLPAGLEAELLFLPNGQGPPQITPQPLTAEGSFRFEGLDTDPVHRYLVRVNNAGQEVASEILAFAEGQTTLQTTVRLTPVTSETSALSVPEISYLLDARPEGWIVAGLLSFLNEGAATIVNEEQPPVRTVVPPEAFELDVPDADPTQPLTILQEEDGFSFAGPIRPGESQLIYSFLLPYSEGSQSVTLPTGIGVPRLRVLVPEIGQETTSNDFVQTGESETLSDRTFSVWTVESVPPDRALTLSFENLPPPPAPMEPLPEDTTSGGAIAPAGPRTAPISPLETIPWWTVFVPLALLLGGLVAYLLLRPAPSVTENAASLRKQRDTLIAEIAALDIRFEAGAIGEQTHRKQREALKRELKIVLRQLESVPLVEVTA